MRVDVQKEQRLVVILITFITDFLPIRSTLQQIKHDQFMSNQTHLSLEKAPVSQFPYSSLPVPSLPTSLLSRCLPFPFSLLQTYSLSLDVSFPFLHFFLPPLFSKFSLTTSNFLFLTSFLSSSPILFFFSPPPSLLLHSFSSQTFQRLFTRSTYLANPSIIKVNPCFHLITVKESRIVFSIIRDDTSQQEFHLLCFIIRHSRKHLIKTTKRYFNIKNQLRRRQF